MRALVQVVKNARVEVDGETVSSIGPGLLCLIGIATGDTLERDGAYIAKKILKARVFSNASGDKKWSTDVMASGLDILLVSQFTLYGSFKKNKPDWSKAMPPQQARAFYEAFKAQLQGQYAGGKVLNGVFGAMMDVHLVNDGPITFMLDSGVPEGGAHAADAPPSNGAAQ